MQIQQKTIVIDDNSYNIEIIRNKIASAHALRIIVPTYMPNKSAAELTRVCCESIATFTHDEFELWVIDNKSPSQYARWLYKCPFVNIIKNRTEPINPFLQKKIKKSFLRKKNITQFKDVSYANAIGLELGIKCIDQTSQYVFVMHSDTVVMTHSWYAFLRSKLNDRVKLAAFRKDPHRIHALHIGGMLIDFAVFKECGMSFMPNMRQERYPDLPEYDVGDELTLKALKAGYDIFVSKNSFNEPKLELQIDEGNSLRRFHVDKCFDDNGNVFFMHLGRGAPKSFGGYKEDGKTYPEDWIAYVDRYILNKQKNIMSKEDQRDLAYSLRRFFVDGFYEDAVSSLKPNSTILDLGGKKVNKRGKFNIAEYTHTVEYVNLDVRSQPDHCADVTALSLGEDKYDAVICAETLEHVYDMEKVVAEAFRLLKPGGAFLVTVPFNTRLHPDPKDYARYTDSFLIERLENVGFLQVEVSKQGYFLSVIADMFAGLAKNYKRNDLWGRIFKKVLRVGAIGSRMAALKFESTPRLKYDPYVTSYTTGYGVIARKPHVMKVEK